MEWSKEIIEKKEKIFNKIDDLNEKRNEVQSKLDELELKNNPSIDREMKLQDKLDKIDEQLSKFVLYFFNSVINLSIPSKVLELCNIPLIKEEYVFYLNILKNTNFKDDFDEITVDDLERYMKKDKTWNKIYDFRKIAEKDNVDLNEKIKMLNKWKFWHPFFSNEIIRNKDGYKKIINNKLTFGDYLIAETYSNLGLPMAIDLYIIGYRTKNDFINADINNIVKINRFGPKRKIQFETFRDKVKNTENFDTLLWKFENTI